MRKNKCHAATSAPLSRSQQDRKSDRAAQGMKRYRGTSEWTSAAYILADRS